MTLTEIDNVLATWPPLVGTKYSPFPKSPTWKICHRQIFATKVISSLILCFIECSSFVHLFIKCFVTAFATFAKYLPIKSFSRWIKLIIMENFKILALNVVHLILPVALWKATFARFDSIITKFAIFVEMNSSMSSLSSHPILKFATLINYLQINHM